ncbi:MAG TPA: response regulator [Tepidisphaeraceae bacterium]|nr:response regulator [Tepidisphaeraceae bacterium]
MTGVKEMNSTSGAGATHRRVLIVEDDVLVGMGLKAHLERLGHAVVGQASTGAEAMAQYREHVPDIVLMDIRLNGSDGIDVARDLLAERRCPMIVISAYSDRELIDRASDAGVFGYLIKPASAEALRAQIEVAVRRFDEQEKLSAEKRELEQTLETRKLVERAKGIFMKRLSLDESEAHKRLQQESQKRRMGIAELAKKVIESEELFKG